MRVAIFREKTENLQGNGFSALIKAVKDIFLFTRYLVLLGLLILFTGYEAANPKIGNTSVEFYTNDFRQGIKDIILMERIDSVSISNISDLSIEFFIIRQYMPAWTLNFELNDNYRKLHALLAEASNYGLFPSNYAISNLDHLEAIMNGTGNDDLRLKARIELELNATESALRFMTHLSAGYRHEDTTSFYVSLCRKLPAYLNSITSEINFREKVLDLQPNNNEYIRLQQALQLYLDRAEKDTVRYTPEKLIKNNHLVAERLCSQGFLDWSFKEDSEAVVAALYKFQLIHNIEPTGILDNQTILALTHNTKDNFIKIAVNLDRLRKDQLQNDNCVLVNIPEFRLHYYNPKGELRSYNVIVGKKSTPTPLLESRIERIIANPYWTVPKSITFNEFIPKIRKDSLYLQKHGYSVIDNFENPVDESMIDWDQVKWGEFNYWIRQPNGGNNALGAVKFLFPNRFSVYLHDTPSKRLFGRKVRAFSHGCIRVQEPEKLAQSILLDYTQDDNGGVVDFGSVISKKDRTELRLDKSLPLYIRYYTCTADTLGNIYYHPDIYNKDDSSIEEIMAYLSVD